MEQTYDTEMKKFWPTKRLKGGAATPRGREMAGTLEARVDATLRDLGGNLDAVTDYLLRAVPLIRDYVEDVSEEPSGMDRKGHLDSFVQVTATSSKNAILQKYMQEFDNGVYAEQGDTHIIQQTTTSVRRRKDLRQTYDPTDWVCKNCDASTYFEAAMAMMVCQGCGLTRPHLEFGDMSFNERANTEVISHCCYKRLNHFVRFG
jgi:hypothetical protein